MVLKTKVSLGIGFLFLIIFALAGFCSYYIQKLSRDSDNILKDNYRSLTYTKNMSLALTDMHTAVNYTIFNPDMINKPADYHVKSFASAQTVFDRNLKDEQSNITELHEQDYVDQLCSTYDLYVHLYLKVKQGAGSPAVYFSELLPAHEKLRQTISAITDINMQAIVRKNELAQQTAARAINAMAIIVTICLLLAFGYFWYFPFYVANSLSYLSGKMRDLLKTAGITLDIQSDDETHILLRSINLLENKFSVKEKAKTARQIP